jgi:hypothetical protein
VVQHEVGWRPEYAYPKQLYAFTDDGSIAGGLREPVPRSGGLGCRYRAAPPSVADCPRNACERNAGMGEGSSYAGRAAFAAWCLVDDLAKDLKQVVTVLRTIDRRLDSLAAKGGA